MTDGIQIRSAAEGDAEVLADLGTVLGYPVGAERMRSRLREILNAADDQVLVAVDPAGRVRGWVQAHAAHRLHTGRGVEIVGLVVDGEMRRQGIGRRLVAEVERWAEARSAEWLAVRSNLQRIDSHRFFLGLGFRLSKRQAVYRKDPGQQA